MKKLLPLSHEPPAFLSPEASTKVVPKFSLNKFCCSLPALSNCNLAMYVSLHPKVAHRRHNVFPVPVGDSSKPLNP